MVESQLIVSLQTYMRALYLSSSFSELSSNVRMYIFYVLYGHYDGVVRYGSKGKGKIKAGQVESINWAEHINKKMNY